MTREHLEKCFATRREILIVEKQLAACGENSYQLLKLKARWEKLAAELDAVEDYIDSLDDSLLRQIVTLHFVEGVTLKEVGKYVGYCDKQVRRYIKKLYSTLQDHPVQPTPN